MKKKQLKILDELLKLYKDAQTAVIKEWSETVVRDGELCVIPDELAVKNLNNAIAYYRKELSSHCPTPLPLLFSGVENLGFRVIISNEVPANQIWFATKEQLHEALEYSQKQIEQVLKETHDRFHTQSMN